GEGRRAATGERNRHGDLRGGSDRDGHERPRSKPTRSSERRRLNGPSFEPRLPPWWLDEAGEDEAVATLEGAVDADVCVVGAGYTGLWTALAVCERDPGARVVVLEAERCGAGPSGRNGGFCHGYWASLAETRLTLGDEGALALARAGERIIPAVRGLGGDVWLREGGLLMVSTAPAQDAAVEAAIGAAAALGAPGQAVARSAQEVAT